MSQEPLPLSIDYASRTTSDLRHPYATTALLLAAVGLAVPPLGAAAIWLGRLSRRLSGAGGFAPARRAKWAIALGAIALAAQLTGGSIYAVHAIDVSRKARCAANINAIYQAILVYADSNRGNEPAQVANLHPHLVNAGRPHCYTCPTGDSHVTAAIVNDSIAFKEKTLDYVLVRGQAWAWRGKGLPISELARKPVLIERLANHHDGSHVVFADRAVRFVDRDSVLNLADKALKTGQIDQASYDAIVGK